MRKKPDLDVVCVGILVADMFASPLPELPAGGELRLVDEILVDTGGCAANTGVSLAKLGSKVAVIGKVGHDVFGDFIVRDLAAKGLDVAGVQRSPTLGTSKTMILSVIGEDRRFIHTFGANADLSYEDINLREIANAKVLYVGGYLALPKLGQEALVRLFMFAKKRGVKTVLDLVAPAGQDEHGVSTHLAQVLSYTDVFLPNDDEARLLTDMADPVAQAQCFLSCGCPNVVIKMGEKGVLAANQSEMFRAAAFQVEVVDPSGAGDAFDAGYIFGLLHGWTLPKTLEFASAIGASACTKLGCTPGVFTLPEAKAFLEKNHLEIRQVH